MGLKTAIICQVGFLLTIYVYGPIEVGVQEGLRSLRSIRHKGIEIRLLTLSLLLPESLQAVPDIKVCCFSPTRLAISCLSQVDLLA